ncbi:MAG: hypothetical protein HYT73_01985 [Candidatus Aenigmarchaeota archaeon]|nr:hypothetical protein [Candidatus Aenigmarchaeota archaeon]
MKMYIALLMIFVVLTAGCAGNTQISEQSTPDSNVPSAPSTPSDTGDSAPSAPGGAPSAPRIPG